MKIRRISIQLCYFVSRIVTLFKTFFAFDLPGSSKVPLDVDVFGVLISCHLKPRMVRVAPKAEQCLIDN